MVRLTRKQYSELVLGILKGEQDAGPFQVDEVDGGYTMTLDATSPDLQDAPVLCGSYHGSVLRDGLQVTDELGREWSAQGVDKERVLDFVISSSSKDRYGDVVRPTGMQKKNFRRNPVVLWAHEYYALPVGRSLREMRDGQVIQGSAEFIDAALSDFADTVFRYLKGGYLSAVSIGFMPIKTQVIKEADDDDGDPWSWWPNFEYVEWDLLEYSIVPVPANPDAIIEGRSAGIDDTPYKQWAERHLDACESGACRRGIASQRKLEEVYARTYGRGRSSVVVPAGNAGLDGDPPTDPPAIGKAVPGRLDVVTSPSVARAMRRFNDLKAKIDAGEMPSDEVRERLESVGTLLAATFAADGDGDGDPGDTDEYVSMADFRALVERINALEDWMTEVRSGDGSSPDTDPPAGDGSSPDGGEPEKGASSKEMQDAVKDLFGPGDAAE